MYYCPEVLKLCFLHEAELLGAVPKQSLGTSPTYTGLSLPKSVFLRLFRGDGHKGHYAESLFLSKGPVSFVRSAVWRFIWCLPVF
ncbi:MAG: hypothetical protein D3916_04775 [Candidatus Electrothrix sp. MAN1_4]|nr:hypothetical protein [Candidatus Electrothrix sp. MAN1_4]